MDCKSSMNIQCQRCILLEKENEMLREKLDSIKNLLSDDTLNLTKSIEDKDEEEVEIISSRGINIDNMYSEQVRELQLQKEMNMVFVATEAVADAKKKLGFLTYAASWLSFL